MTPTLGYRDVQKANITVKPAKIPKKNPLKTYSHEAADPTLETIQYQIAQLQLLPQRL